jgi:hypothetical protein
MKMPIKHWTRQERKTKMFYRLKLPNSCAVRSLKKYLNLQNKVLKTSFGLSTCFIVAVLIVLFLFAELIDFKTRRVAAFRKNLVELAELELKHAKVVSLNI